MSDFFAEGERNRAQQSPKKNEGYLPCTHSLDIDIDKFAKQQSLQNQSLKLISTSQIIFF